MGFYDNFIRLCNERKETPTAVSQAVGLDKSAASRWKRGALPRDPVTMRIADYFGVSVAELVGDIKPEEHTEDTPSVAEVANKKDDLEAALEALRNQPGRRALLSATRNMTEAQVLRFADWLADITGGNKD